MVWDGCIFLTLIFLCLAGWNVGLINSWRGPIAMILSTILTQQFYVDFGTWIAQQMLLQPDWCAFLGYLMLWVVCDIVLEIVMSLFLPWNRKERPVMMDRIGGVLLASLRWAMIFVFPVMAMTNDKNSIPVAPEQKDVLVNSMDTGIKDAKLIAVLKDVADSLKPGIGEFVISTKEPSFKPNFERVKVKVD